MSKALQISNSNSQVELDSDEEGEELAEEVSPEFGYLEEDDAEDFEEGADEATLVASLYESGITDEKIYRVFDQKMFQNSPEIQRMLVSSEEFFAAQKNPVDFWRAYGEISAKLLEFFLKEKIAEPTQALDLVNQLIAACATKHPIFQASRTQITPLYKHLGDQLHKKAADASDVVRRFWQSELVLANRLSLSGMGTFVENVWPLFSANKFDGTKTIAQTLILARQLALEYFAQHHSDYRLASIPLSLCEALALPFNLSVERPVSVTLLDTAHYFELVSHLLPGEFVFSPAELAQLQQQDKALRLIKQVYFPAKSQYAGYEVVEAIKRVLANYWQMQNVSCSEIAAFLNGTSPAPKFASLVIKLRACEAFSSCFDSAGYFDALAELQRIFRSDFTSDKEFAAVAASMNLRPELFKAVVVPSSSIADNRSSVFGGSKKPVPGAIQATNSGLLPQSPREAEAADDAQGEVLRPVAPVAGAQ